MAQGAPHGLRRGEVVHGYQIEAAEGLCRPAALGAAVPGSGSRAAETSARKRRKRRQRPPRWATVTRQVAAAVGADPAAVRRALATALQGERDRAGY